MAHETTTPRSSTRSQKKLQKVSRLARVCRADQTRARWSVRVTLAGPGASRSMSALMPAAAKSRYVVLPCQVVNKCMLQSLSQRRQFKSDTHTSSQMSRRIRNRGSEPLVLVKTAEFALKRMKKEPEYCELELDASPDTEDWHDEKNGLVHHALHCTDRS